MKAVLEQEKKQAINRDNKKVEFEELEFCLSLWEKKGHCGFGEKTLCSECGAPYVLWKMISGEVLHGDTKRLTLEEWKEKVRQFKN